MTVLKCHSEMDDETTARARRILRLNLRECPDVMTDDDMADAVIEQVWNALIGVPTADETD